jgi:hypothetical protein
MPPAPPEMIATLLASLPSRNTPAFLPDIKVRAVIEKHGMAIYI